MTITVLTTSHGRLLATADDPATSPPPAQKKRASHKTTPAPPVYLKFVVSHDAPVCFWDAIKELNDCLNRACMTGHQILINQGSFQVMHAAHVQVRLHSASDLEKLLFSSNSSNMMTSKKKKKEEWADDVDDD